jgi:dihydrolipoamide dehydrogenase
LLKCFADRKDIKMKYDIAILGAGPGGYVAAIKAAHLGAKVTLIEKDEVGGVCLNRGCIPTKSLIASGEVYRHILDSKKFGITINEKPIIDIKEVINRKNKIVQVLTSGIKSLLKGNKIDLFSGTGFIENRNEIRIDSNDKASPEIISTDKIIISTGSKSISLPGLTLDGEHIISSDEALNMTSIPNDILIVGAGVIGCEFAFLYNNLGSNVTLIELLDRALPIEDSEISSIIEREFKKRKIRLITKEKLEKISVESDGKMASITSGGTSLKSDVILVSVGRVYNSDGIGLEKIGIKLGKRGVIEVDDRMETNVPGVYAIGDVAGEPFYAHKASHEGNIAVKNALGKDCLREKRVIPYGIFTHPEIGGVGISEDEAKNRGIDYKVGKFNLRGLGRAQSLSEIDGLVKVISDGKTDEILGARLIGANASEIVHVAACAMQARMKTSELADMIFSHPTMSEGLVEALHDVHGCAIHNPKVS